MPRYPGNRRMSLIVFVSLMMTTRVLADRSIVHEGTVNATPAEVWNALTTSEGFASWAVSKAEIDLRLGGEMRTHYEPNGTLGDENSIVNQIIAFEPERMLSIRNIKAPKQLPHAELFQRTWTVLTLRPGERAANQTAVRIATLGFGEGPDWDVLHDLSSAGNAATLEALVNKFAAATTQPQHEDDPRRVTALLRRLAGGEWVHERSSDDDKVFRVRNVIEQGPDGESLILRGWLGNEKGMSAHSACLIWREPTLQNAGATPQVMFRNVDEGGAIARGTIRLADENAVVWDWNHAALDGTKMTLNVVMQFTGADAYTMRIDRIGDDGQASQIVEAEFKRVERAPPEFLIPAGP